MGKTEIIRGIGMGTLLWMGIVFTVIGYSYPKYVYLGIGILLTYSILNEFTPKP